MSLPDIPNPDNVPTFGFMPMQLRDKRQCAACNRKVWYGIVNINNPEGAVVCMECSRSWDEGPTSFEEAVGIEELQ